MSQAAEEEFFVFFSPSLIIYNETELDWKCDSNQFMENWLLLKKNTMTTFFFLDFSKLWVLFQVLM